MKAARTQIVLSVAFLLSHSGAYAVTPLLHLEELNTELSSLEPALECTSEVAKPITFEQKICADPYEAICKDPEIERRLKNGKAQADQDYYAILSEVTDSQVKAEDDILPALKKVVKGLEIEEMKIKVIPLERKVEEKTLAQLKITSLDSVFKDVKAAIVAQIMAEVAIDLTTKKLLIAKINELKFSVGDGAYPKTEKQLCGAIGNKYGIGVGPETGGRRELMICPRDLLMIVRQSPNLSPAAAIQQSLTSIFAHEFTHQFWDEALGSFVTRWDATKSKKNLTGMSDAELIHLSEEMEADYWAVDSIAEQVLKLPKTRTAGDIKDLLVGSSIGLFCSFNISDEHATVPFRVRLLTRVTKFRRAMGCEPWFLAEKGCDVLLRESRPR